MNSSISSFWVNIYTAHIANFDCRICIYMPYLLWRLFSPISLLSCVIGNLTTNLNIYTLGNCKYLLNYQKT